MDDYKKLRADFERMKKNEHERIADRVLAERAADAEKIAGPDHRDAEIAALKAEVERLTSDLVTQGECIDRLTVDLLSHKRALAAGPAALRGDWVQLGAETAAEVVEAAQAEAMKEKS